MTHEESSPMKPRVRLVINHAAKPVDANPETILLNKSGLSPEVIAGLTDNEKSLVMEFISGPDFGKRGGRNKYNLPRLVYRAKMVHGNVYNYDKVTRDQVDGRESTIPVICNKCGTEFTVQIYKHIIHEMGCYYCSKTGKWDYYKFMRRALEKHGSKFDYSLVKPEDIVNCNSRIQIKCATCSDIKITEVNTHIHNGLCSKCKGTRCWDYKYFISQAVQIHGNTYDYSNIKPPISSRGMVTIKCNICQHIWECQTANHINRKSRCPNCYNHIPWTVDRFIVESKKINGGKYNYDKIGPNDITGAYSKVKLTCNLCDLTWISVLHDHISCRAGCPSCAGTISKGAEECAKVLEKLVVNFDREVSLVNCPRKRYDFEFSYNGDNYLLEFDGKQHFEYIQYFHSTQDMFEEKKQMDIEKTLAGINAGYKFIRIAYDSLTDIENHVLIALDSREKIYFSNKVLYKHIIDALKY